MFDESLYQSEYQLKTKVKELQQYVKFVWIVKIKIYVKFVKVQTLQKTMKLYTVSFQSTVQWRLSLKRSISLEIHDDQGKPFHETSLHLRKATVYFPV